MIVACTFGAAFSSIISAAFAAYLTKILKVGDLAFGLIMASGPAAAVFLFLGSLAAERAGRVKRLYVGFTLVFRLSWLCLAAVPLVFGSFPNLWATGLVGLIVFAGSAAASYGGAGLTVWMAAVVPKQSAGRYFALRATAGLWSMIVTGFVVGKLVDIHSDTPWVYSLFFTIAAVFGATEVLCFLRVPEKQRPVEEERPSIWSILWVPWRNGLFRSVTLYSAISWFTFSLVDTFLWPFCLMDSSKNGLGFGVFASFLVISLLPMISMALTSPFWGMAIDRFGPKPVLRVGLLINALSALVWLVVHRTGGTPISVGPWTITPDLIWFIPIVEVLGGLTWPAVEQGVFYVQIKAFPEVKRSAYIASYDVSVQVAAMLGSAFAAFCAGFWAKHAASVPVFPDWFSQYQPIILTAFVIRMSAFLLLFPRLRLEGVAGFGEVIAYVAAQAMRALPLPWRGR
jgi:MFS family permease